MTDTDSDSETQYLCLDCKKDISDLLTEDFKEYVWDETDECDEEKLCAVCIREKRIEDQYKIMKARGYLIDDYYAKYFMEDNLKKGRYYNPNWSNSRKDKQIE